MRIDNPFHEGEIEAQKRSGEFETGQRNGRMLTDSIMPGALKFIDQQPMVVLGSIDADRRVWASIMFGPPGFVSAPDEHHVEFDLSRIDINTHDPFWRNIETDHRIGALFIELETRRRLRINGSAKRSSEDRLTLDVAECFPNCPKYIQRREIEFEDTGSTGSARPVIDGQALNADQVTMIQSSDTFFVASAHPERNADVSHRGGPPGFVEVIDERTLRIPDYVGNSMYQTLGNIVVNPNAGIVFLDFASNRTLQLTGRAEVLWDDDDAAGRSGGTQRFWTFTVDHWRESNTNVGLRWSLIDHSPFKPRPTQME